MAGGNFKRSTAEIISELLGRAGAQGAGLRPFRRVQGGAGPHPAGCRRPPEERARALPPEEAYPRSRRPREGAHPARLAEVEAEAAELRIRLSELLEQEEELRAALEDL